MSLPYYPMYPRDFHDGTLRMSLELKGAYIMLLNLIYTRGGPVDDEEGYLARYVGCSIRKWQKLRLELIGHGKIVVENGMIRNSRADEELLKRASYQDQQRENRARPNKNKAEESRPREARASSESEPDSTSSSSSSSGAGEDGRDPPQGQVPGERETGWRGHPWMARIFAVAGPGLADPDKNANLMLDLAGRITAWQSAGWNLETEILPVVRAKTSQTRDRPMTNFRFLEEDIVRFRAQLRREPPKLEIIDADPRRPVVVHRGGGASGAYRDPGFAELLRAELEGGEDLRDARTG